MTEPRPTADADVTDDVDGHRYEIRVGTEIAGFAAYARGATADQIVLNHTEVDDRFAGQGLGGRLAKAALDDVRARGLVAVPLCPFIAGYIRHHPEYVDLVDERHRASVQRHP